MVLMNVSSRSDTDARLATKPDLICPPNQAMKLVTKSRKGVFTGLRNIQIN